MQPRRIALVTETFYPATDGTTTTLKHLADHLIDAGHAVMIIAPGPGLPTYRRCRVARIRPLDKPGSQIRAALESFRPDLVHVTSPKILGSKALKQAQRLGVATLVVQHSPIPEVARELWLAKIAARADTMIVTAEHMLHPMHAMGLTSHVWEPGVDSACFTPQVRDSWLHTKWAGPTSRVVVGYAGSLHKRHGVRRLPEVAAVPGVRLIVIGDGPQTPWLRRRLPETKFAGNLLTGELATALASLDVLVHPGESETCCHTLREAGASGIPIVAPRSGGAPRVIRDLENGLLYDPDTPTGLQRAVDSVVGDRQRALMGARGRELSLARDWSRACGELLADHYAPLLGVAAADLDDVRRPLAVG